MKKSVSTAVAGVALALTTSSLALVLPSTAQAATAACNTASATLTKAQAKKTKAVKVQKKAKKAATKAKKALKAKRTKATVKKVKTTKAKLKKANKTVKVANAALVKARKNKASKCKTTAAIKNPSNGGNTTNNNTNNGGNTTNNNTTNQAQAEALAAALKLLLAQQDKGGDVGLLGKDGVKGLLNSVAPNLGTLVSDEILGKVVELLMLPVKQADQVEAMFKAAFGQSIDFGDMTNFDPAALAGTFTNMFKGIADKFGMPAGNLPTFDAAAVTGFLAQMQNLANPDALKGLIPGGMDMGSIFTKMIQGQQLGMSTLDLTNLKSALNLAQAQNLPGLSNLKDLTAMAGVLGTLTNGAGGLSVIPVLGPLLDTLLGGLLKGLFGWIPGFPV